MRPILPRVSLPQQFSPLPATTAIPQPSSAPAIKPRSVSLTSSKWADNPNFRIAFNVGSRSDGQSYPETPKPGGADLGHARNVIVGRNADALLAVRAAAETMGYRTLVLSADVEGEAREVARVAAALAKGVRAHGDPLPPPACLVWGGETTVTIHGEGKGGRNQELALAACLALDGWPGVLLMALATDGAQRHTAGKEILKVVVVPGRLVNIVVR